MSGRDIIVSELLAYQGVEGGGLGTALVGLCVGEKSLGSRG